MGGGLRVQVTRPIHVGEFAALQEDHTRLQSATPRNPAADRRRIHLVEHLGRFPIGYRPATGARVPSGMKSKTRARGHANLVTGNGAKNNGASRCTEAVDHHRFAGTAKLSPRGARQGPVQSIRGFAGAVGKAASSLPAPGKLVITEQPSRAVLSMCIRLILKGLSPLGGIGTGEASIQATKSSRPFPSSSQ